MSSLAPEIRRMYPGEIRLVSIDFTGKLESSNTTNSELVTGTPVVTVDSTVPSVTGISINSTWMTINNSTVSAGQAVLLVFSSTAAGVLYTVRATVGTDATPSQTLVGRVRIQMEST